MIRSNEEIMTILSDKAGVLVCIGLICLLAVFAVWWRGHEEQQRKSRR